MTAAYAATERELLAANDALAQQRRRYEALRAELAAERDKVG